MARSAIWIGLLAAVVAAILVAAYLPGIITPRPESFPQLQTGGQVKNTLAVGEQGFFRGLASGGQPPYQFVWTFPDGTVVQNMNTTKAFDSPGLYEVRVSITDSAGQSRAHSFEIRVVAAQ